MKFLNQNLFIIFLLLLAVGYAQAQPGGGRFGGDPEQMAARQTENMVEALALSEAQGNKLKEINLKYAQKVKEARDNAEGDRPAMREAMMTLRKEQNAELKTILTATQFEKWQEIRAEQRSRRGGPGGQEGRQGKKAKEKTKDKKA